MLKTEKTEEVLTEEPEVYQLNYIVNFYNCTVTNLHLQQTGKPSDPEEPGGSE